MGLIKNEQHMRLESGRRMRFAFGASFVFVAVLWWIRLIETVSGWNFSQLGIEPHVLFGLVGIVFAPLLHASWAHLLANTAPVLILGTALLYGYPRASRFVIPLVWIGTGVGVWFTGRPAFHIGASGLVMGFIVFLLIAGILRHDRPSAAITLAVAFLYGTALVAIVPGSDQHISWESHAWGAVMGLLCAFTLFRLDPLAPRKRYSWEVELDDSEDPVIGNLWQHPSPPEEHRPPPVGKAEWPPDNEDSDPPPRLH